MSEELSIVGLEGSSPERRQAIILLSRSDAYMSEELSINGLDKGSSPERRQAIILTNAGIAYKKFHSPMPVFHSPCQIFTRIGER